MAIALGNASFALDDTTAGWRKTSLDLFSRIINISPTDYPMFNNTGNVRTNNVLVTWQTRTLPSRANNFTLEGANFTFNTTAQPSRVSNSTQIISQGIEVSGSAQAEAHYGIRDLMADQIEYRMEQWKGSAEFALIRATQDSGASDTPRQMDGLLAAITTLASDAAGDTLSESTYIDQQKIIWDQGPKPRDVMTNSSLRTTIDAFNALGKTTWQAPGDATEVTNMLLLYHGSFGTVRNHLSRDLPQTATTSDMVTLDFRNFHKAWLRPVFMRKVDSGADSMQSAIVGELSLKYDDEKAASKYLNILL